MAAATDRCAVPMAYDPARNLSSRAFAAETHFAVAHDSDLFAAKPCSNGSQLRINSATQSVAIGSSTFSSAANVQR
jgi:hypothetical protein